MPQFTNPYNGQNGMTNVGPMPSAGYPSSAWQTTGNPQMMQGNPQSMPMQQPNTQVYVPQQPNTQGWKTYSAPVVRPIVGRWVETFEEIKPQEVPMDGGMYLFPQSDWSCIYAKYWDNNGQLMSFRFLPEKNDVQQTASIPANMGDILQGYEAIATNVLNRLDSVDGRLNDIYSSISQPITATGNNARKKTVDKEEK